MKHIPGMTSLPSNLKAKKSTKIKFSADKIYYIFPQKYRKITNMQNRQSSDSHFKSNENLLT